MARLHTDTDTDTDTDRDYIGFDANTAAVCLGCCRVERMYRETAQLGYRQKAETECAMPSTTSRATIVLRVSRHACTLCDRGGLSEACTAHRVDQRRHSPGSWGGHAKQILLRGGLRRPRRPWLRTEIILDGWAEDNKANCEFCLFSIQQVLLAKRY